jgi:flagellin-like protein
MFDDINDSGRGQVGIGTLIIFIALVLVAAVAAGVLVNTSGELQSRASDTGEDAQAQVSNQIDVVSATGTVDSGNVDELVLVVKKSPGSDPIDLSAATIQYTSSTDSMTLQDTTGFVVQDIDGTPASSKVLASNDERLRVVIALSGSPSALAAGGDAELQIVEQSGASTVYGVNVPDVLSGSYVSV